MDDSGCNDFDRTLDDFNVHIVTLLLNMVLPQLSVSVLPTATTLAEHRVGPGSLSVQGFASTLLRSTVVQKRGIPNLPKGVPRCQVEILDTSVFTASSFVRRHDDPAWPRACAIMVSIQRPARHFDTCCHFRLNATKLHVLHLVSWKQVGG